MKTWEKMKFTVQAYIKGTEKRGSILGSVDEILQNVDNDTMNLQSMSGSRFVGPFLCTIQQWEKDLSLINETVEVSQTVQISHQSSRENPANSISSIAMVAGTAEMDVSGKHIHWWRHSLSVTQ